MRRSVDMFCHDPAPPPIVGELFGRRCPLAECSEFLDAIAQFDDLGKCLRRTGSFEEMDGLVSCRTSLEMRPDKPAGNSMGDRAAEGVADEAKRFRRPSAALFPPRCA
jgi:hypothetical protein